MTLGASHFAERSAISARDRADYVTAQSKTGEEPYVLAHDWRPGCDCTLSSQPRRMLENQRGLSSCPIRTDGSHGDFSRARR